MTVFIVNRSGAKYDLEPLKQWGEIRFISDRYVYSDELTSDGNEIPPSFMNHIIGAANEFKPETDYLVILGDHLQLIAMVVELTMEISSNGQDWFNLLRWDRTAEAYIPIRIRIH